MNLPKIGSSYKLKVPALGCDVGDVGYVFNIFDPNSEDWVIQLIFSNGEFDGFSKEDASFFLEYVGENPKYSSYHFENVMKVSSDFERGFWKWTY